MYVVCSTQVCNVEDNDVMFVCVWTDFGTVCIIIPLAACMHSLVSTLSAPQIFIAYSMKNLRCGNAGYEASACMLPKVL